MLKIIILVAFIILIAILLFLCYCHEKKHYNKGVCKRCGKPLRFFAKDNLGCRGYICDTCLDIAWVSFKIDKGDANND